ncbi:hypothetical protein [Streptomyces sp. NPDC004230]
MPGQRRRKRRRHDAWQQAAARFPAGAGHWDVLFETQDGSEWRAHIHRLRESDQPIDWAAVRIDTLCGRLMQPTTYRLRLFVADPTADAAE